MARKHRSALAALTLSLILLAVTTVSCLPAGHRVPSRQRPVETPTRTAHRRPPNIILITTDDQNVGELRWMPRTRRELAGHGLLFTRALSPDPLCCPARAEILTGQLGQNNGVSSNLGLHGGFPRSAESANTLAVWLRKAGYRTALVGKYLNGYDRPGRAAARLDPVEPVGGRHLQLQPHDVLPGRQPANLPQERDPRRRGLRAAVRPGVLGHAQAFLHLGLVPPAAPETKAPRRQSSSHPCRPGRHRHDLERVPAPFLAKPTFGRTQAVRSPNPGGPSRASPGRPCSHCSPGASSRCRMSTPPWPG